MKRVEPPPPGSSTSEVKATIKIPDASSIALATAKTAAAQNSSSVIFSRQIVPAAAAAPGPPPDTMPQQPVVTAAAAPSAQQPPVAITSVQAAAAAAAQAAQHSLNTPTFARLEGFFDQFFRLTISCGWFLRASIKNHLPKNFIRRFCGSYYTILGHQSYLLHIF